ncbi:hypothetical protein [Nocardioides pantholopis]|uniref:hypothetical protein n=1 Tax=Nocardioides pantholopis TaxID=2483798 RepID=UPI000FD7DAE9|nr:hypothetical protein [Nocardioides pantholopis]
MSSMTGYPTLGFDPVENDPGASAEIAAELRTATQRLGEVDQVLRGAGDQAWQGHTAEAFRDSVSSELTPRVSEAYQAFCDASRAFDAWVDILPTYCSRADALEEAAVAAAAQVDSALGETRSLSEPAPDADASALADHATQRQQLSDSLDAARGELDRIRGEAEALRTEVRERAGIVAAAFTTAADSAPDEPGFWERAGDFLADARDMLGEAFDWFMENLAPLLQQLARIVGAVATILSIVCFVVGFVFPPAFALAGTLGTVAKVASFVDLGIQGLRVLHGEDGALQGLLLQAGGMAAGFGLARAIGPIAVNTESILKGGLYTPVLAGVSVGTGGAGATATAALTVNPDAIHALTYWGITRFRDLNDAFGTLEREGR